MSSASRSAPSETRALRPQLSGATHRHRRENSQTPLHGRPLACLDGERPADRVLNPCGAGGDSQPSAGSCCEEAGPTRSRRSHSGWGASHL